MTHPGPTDGMNATPSLLSVLAAAAWTGIKRHTGSRTGNNQPRATDAAEATNRGRPGLDTERAPLRAFRTHPVLRLRQRRRSPRRKVRVCAVKSSLSDMLCGCRQWYGAKGRAVSASFFKVSQGRGVGIHVAGCSRHDLTVAPAVSRMSPTTNASLAVLRIDFAPPGWRTFVHSSVRRRPIIKVRCPAGDARPHARPYPPIELIRTHYCFDRAPGFIL